MADIFISYKSARRPAVHHLAQVLVNHGYSVWFDYELHSGIEFAPQIERELRAARAVIVLWCSLSTESEWVKDEARIAKELKTLIPARIEAASLPLGHGGLDTIDLASWDGNPRVGAALDRLLGQLSIKVCRDPVPNFRALSEQEAQWRVHRKGLADFPLDEAAEELERKRGKPTVSTVSDAPTAGADRGRIATEKPEPATIAPSETPRATAQNELTVRLLINRSVRTTGVSRASFSPDSQFIVLPDDRNTASILDCDSGKVVQTLYGHTQSNSDIEEVHGAAYSADGRRIVTASSDNTARVWDSDSGRELVILIGHTEPVYSASFSPDGRRIVTASGDKTARIWDSETGQLIATLAGRKFLILRADVAQKPVFSPDGRRIVTTSDDQIARVWDSDTGRVRNALTGHHLSVTCATFSPDGRRIVTGSYSDTNRVWDSETCSVTATLLGARSATSVAFSPDGCRIAMGLWGNTAGVWESETGRVLATLAGHTGRRVGSVDFSPDGRRIVTTSDDKTAKVWNSESGRALATLIGHTDRLSSAAFSPDGLRIVTASADKTVRVWGLE